MICIFKGGRFDGGRYNFDPDILDWVEERHICQPVTDERAETVWFYRSSVPYVRRMGQMVFHYSRKRPMVTK